MRITTGFEEGNDHHHNSEFDSLQYISEETIARAILKPCCREECLRRKLNSSPRSSCLNFESVYTKILDARKQLVGNTIKDKMLILKTIIQGNIIMKLLIFTHAYLFAVFRRSFYKKRWFTETTNESQIPFIL
jgi:hypothetical protein